MHPNHAMQPMPVYEIRPRKDKRGVDLISDALPFGRLCYAGTDFIIARDGRIAALDLFFDKLR